MKVIIGFQIRLNLMGVSSRLYYPDLVAIALAEKKLQQFFKVM